MFKNHTMQVKLVKTPAGEAETAAPVETANPDAVIASATVAIEELMQESIKMVAIYMAMDTARKIVLTLVAK